SSCFWCELTVARRDSRQPARTVQAVLLHDTPDQDVDHACLTFRPWFADSGALTRADAERPELASWEGQLAVPSASTYYDAHDVPALSFSRIWHATRKYEFYHGFAITLDLSLLLRPLGKHRRGLTFRPWFADSGALTRADAERPELASWEGQLAVPSASTDYDAHDMPALSFSRVWHATRKHEFYHGFAITLDLLLLLRPLGKHRPDVQTMVRRFRGPDQSSVVDIQAVANTERATLEIYGYQMKATFVYIWQADLLLMERPVFRCMAATLLLKTSRHQAARGKADSDARTSLLPLPNLKAVDYDDDVPTWTSSCSKVAALQHEGHPAIKDMASEAPHHLVALPAITSTGVACLVRSSCFWCELTAACRDSRQPARTVQAVLLHDTPNQDVDHACVADIKAVASTERATLEIHGLTFRPWFADSGVLTSADAERPELASWEQQLAVPSASTDYDAHDMPALSFSRIWRATRKHEFYHGFAITLDLLLLLRPLGKHRCMAATLLLKTSRHQAARVKADSDARTSLLPLPNLKAVDYDDDVPTWTSSCSKVAALQHEGHPAIKLLRRCPQVGRRRPEEIAPAESPSLGPKASAHSLPGYFQQLNASAAPRTWLLKLPTTWSRCLPSHPLASLPARTVQAVLLHDTPNQDAVANTERATLEIHGYQMKRPVFRRLVHGGNTSLRTSRHQAARGKADSDARTSLLLLPILKAVDYDDDVGHRRPEEIAPAESPSLAREAGYFQSSCFQCELTVARWDSRQPARSEFAHIQMCFSCSVCHGPAVAKESLPYPTRRLAPNTTAPGWDSDWSSPFESLMDAGRIVDGCELMLRVNKASPDSQSSQLTCSAGFFCFWKYSQLGAAAAAAFRGCSRRGQHISALSCATGYRASFLPPAVA
ncbi:unnamed protein product, partial [Polarella glacialis]